MEKEDQVSPGKLIGYLIAMTLLGIVSFIILAAVVQARHRMPIEPVPAEAAKSAEPVAVLKEGLENSLQVARINFQAGHRAKALRALNAAHHAAELGKSVTSDPFFVEAFDRIEKTRRALENGHPKRAPEILSGIVAQKQSGSSVSLNLPPNLGEYDGATVINASGLRVGEVENVSGDRAHLKLGLQDVLGFIDLGRTSVDIPVNRLVFGKKKGVGPTMVCLPVYAQKPDEIRRAIAQ